MRRSRKAATACSFAALMAAGASPPAFIACRAMPSAGNRSGSGGSNRTSIARLQSSFAATPSRRSGHVNAYWIGSFMSGGLSWAITEPSLYSTIECTIDCGWITTAICSADSPNSQRASMISNALFINVAESTVIFGPIAQVGWAKASATVTWASCAAENVRNGPPLAVSTTRRTSSRRPACNA